MMMAEIAAESSEQIVKIILVEKQVKDEAQEVTLGGDRNLVLNAEVATKASEQELKPNQCPKCGHTYTRKTTLRKHMAIAHNEVIPVERPQSKHKCLHASCSEEFRHITAMLQHLKEKHGDTVDETSYEFDSMEDFKHWKEIEETQNFVFFAKSGSVVAGKHYFVCQRHGSQRPHRSKDEPGRKTSRRNKRGSVKSNMICPARMFVKASNSGKVTVKYIHSHNHPVSIEDTERQPLPPSLRDTIKTKLAMGVTEQDILNTLREGNSDGDNLKSLPLKRKYFVTKQQLKGMKRHKYGPKRLNDDDATSVYLKVTNLMGELYNPILMYEEKGQAIQSPDLDEEEDIFFLALQTEEQCQMLADHGEKMLYVDTMRSTDKYNMKLVNLIVVDRSNKGHVVGHLITNRIYKIILKKFFIEIQKRVPTVRFSVVMTDDVVDIFDAIVEVFGNEDENLKHLHSKWSSHCTFLKLLNVSMLCENIAKNIQKEMYHQLVRIMEEQTFDAFSVLAAQFIQQYASICPSFVEIFKTKYLTKPQEWAMCYRYSPKVTREMDASLYPENLQRRLRAYYLHGSQRIRRVDDLIDVLLTAENEDCWRRKGEEEYKMDVQAQSVSHHEDGLLIPDHLVDSNEAMKMWKIGFPERIVTRIQEDCTEDYCEIMCLEWSCIGLCQHLYVCSCPDGAMLCQHKHKVHSMQMRAIAAHLNQADHIIEHHVEHEDDHNQIEQIIQTINDPQSALHIIQDQHHNQQKDPQDSLKSLPSNESEQQIQTKNDPQTVVIQTIQDHVHHQSDPQDSLKSSQVSNESEQQIQTKNDPQTVIIQTIQDHVHHQSYPQDLHAPQEPRKNDSKNDLQRDQDSPNHHSVETVHVAEDSGEHEDYEVYVRQGPSAETQIQVDGILSQMEVLRGHLQNDKVQQLLLPHVSETLSHLISQCSMVINADVVEVTEQGAKEEGSKECDPQSSL